MAPSLPAAATKSQTSQASARQDTMPKLSKTGGSTPSTSRISKSKPKSKSNPPNANDNDHRIKTDVLIAIKPIHLANILSQKKNHEYRNYRLHDDVVRLWLYETKDGGEGRASITHIAVVPKGIRHTPGTVPIEPFGIGNDDFNSGLKQSKYGYPVLEVYELVEPVALAEMKSKWGMGAPMGWRYVGAHLWGDRWGEDEERAGRVTRVF